MWDPNAIFVPAAPQLSATKLAEIWRNIFPWEDLRAQQPPEHWLTLGKEILPTLSVLATGGGGAPKMLRADSAGRLQIAGLGITIDQVAVGAGPGIVQIPVADTSLYSVGMVLVTVSGEPVLPYFEVSRVNALLTIGSQPMVQVDRTLNLFYHQSSPIFLLPMTALVGHALPKKPYDFDSTVAPGLGLQAILTLPAVVGKRYLVDKVDGSLLQNTVAPAAAVLVLSLADGATIKRFWYAGVTASPGDSRSLLLSDVNFRGSINTALTVNFNGAFASVFEAVNIAGWVVDANDGPNVAGL